MLSKNSANSVNIDFIRGIAALAVMLGHLRAALFDKYSAVTSPSMATKLFYFLTGAGAEAVMVFFVLSGFLVGSHAYNQIKNQTYSWSHYLISRLIRLYLVLIPALLLSACITYFAYPLFIHELAPYPLTVSNFIGNVLFLQTISTHSFAGNLPLWSLSNEFWYYLIFPMLVIFFLKKNLTVVGYLFLALAILYWIGFAKSIYFSVWLMGFAIYQLIKLRPIHLLRQNLLLRSFISYLALSGLAIEICLGHMHILSQTFLNFIAAGFFSIFLYLSLQNDTLSSKKGCYYAVAHTTASCSYTLYLIHYPMILLIERALLKNNNEHWPLDITHLLYAFLIALGIFYFAYLFAQCTEAKTMQVKKFVLTRLRTTKQPSIEI